MILARLSRAIRQQNWFAVVLEFVIVVSGVLLAFQVNAWNEARQDRSDESQFIQELHDDIVLAHTMSSRVRERRLELLALLIDAVETVHGRTDNVRLTDGECRAIASIQYFNINVPDLTSFTELTNANRLGIIRDEGLRRALIDYGQSSVALRNYISIQTSVAHDLPFIFPDLISTDSYFDPVMGEIRARPSCQLQGMQANRQFLNALAGNADVFDAYIRDGLAPWSDQLDRVHDRVDAILYISHDPAEAAP